MGLFFSDLHIHIGRTRAGRAVKVTASSRLTLPAIVEGAVSNKGLDVIGIVDAAAPDVLSDIEAAVAGGMLREGEGVLRYRDRLSVVLASEVEVPCGSGRAHFLAYLPGLAACRLYSRWLTAQVTNANLSTPLLRCSFEDFHETVKALGGLIVAAHIFTPYRGLLGACGDNVDELESIVSRCDAVELGLSSDTALALRIPFLRNSPYIAASDAHSVENIAREYTVLMMSEGNFPELAAAIRADRDRKVAALYGLDPRLGKYHRTYCLVCRKAADELPPVLRCSRDPQHPVVKGVRDRIEQLARLCNPGGTAAETGAAAHDVRAPYVHQVPLRFIPGVGEKTYRRLIDEFGSEMAVLHRTSLSQLAATVGERLARVIDMARRGKTPIATGGGGIYGRLISGGPLH